MRKRILLWRPQRFRVQRSTSSPSPGCLLRVVCRGRLSSPAALCGARLSWAGRGVPRGYRDGLSVPSALGFARLRRGAGRGREGSSGRHAAAPRRPAGPLGFATRESSGTREYSGGGLGGARNASPPGHARPPAGLEGTCVNIPPVMCRPPRVEPPETAELRNKPRASPPAGVEAPSLYWGGRVSRKCNSMPPAFLSSLVSFSSFPASVSSVRSPRPSLSSPRSLWPLCVGSRGRRLPRGQDMHLPEFGAPLRAPGRKGGPSRRQAASSAERRPRAGAPAVLADTATHARRRRTAGAWGRGRRTRALSRTRSSNAQSSAQCSASSRWGVPMFRAF